MTNANGVFMLALSLAAFTACPSYAQTSVDEEISASSKAAPVAYVYVGTANGVNLYNAAASGALTLVQGSPFQTSGLAIGSNGKYFISLGTDWIHSYSIASNGAIQKQVSTINTQEYNGASCGTTGGAVLDHSGHDLYVLIEGANVSDSGQCGAYQSFSIASGTGQLAFAGAVVSDWWTLLFSLPAITGGNKLAYAILEPEQFDTTMPLGLKRQSNGSLGLMNFKMTVPKDKEGGPGYLPTIFATDPTDHLASDLMSTADGGPNQLGSFTVDSSGNLTSTNNWKNMPALPDINVGPMNFSPSGKLLAIGGVQSMGSCGANGAPSICGLQIFHFNGAAPITPFSAVLNLNVPIDQIHWDNNNHLYALSDETNALYVYTVTPTSITQAPGSPYAIIGPNALVVVPK
jgi:hypothetical protein